MQRSLWSVLLCLAAWMTSVQAADVIREIDLSHGRDAVNTVTAPVYDGAAQLLVEPITAKYDKKQRFVRRMGGNMFTKGPEYDLDPQVDLAALLTESLQGEASVMGFRPQTADTPAWRLSGTLDDIYLESRQVYMGATLFYGFMEISLELTAPSGTRHSRRLRLHDYYGGYNAGMGRKDEAQEGAAHLLIEGAQELLARLNREFMRMPSHPAMRSKLEQLRPGTLDDRAATIRSVGLSGVEGAGSALLTLIASEPEENRRTNLIEAVGLLGTPEAVASLDARYVTEAEDCRWAILKALDYIGGADAERVIAARGSKDPDGGPRRLAERITRPRK